MAHIKAVVKQIFKKVTLNRRDSRFLRNYTSKHSRNVSFDPVLQRALWQYMDKYSDNTWRVLNEIIKCYGRYNSVINISQSTIARNIGICREQVNRIIRELCSLGFVSKITRFKKTCLYRVHRFFSTQIAKSCLSYILPAIFWLSPNFIYSSENYTTDKCHSNIKRIYINNNYNVSRVRMSNKNDRFLTREERHYNKCLESRERNRQQYEDILNNPSNGVVDSQKQIKTPTVTEYKRIPTEADIPKEHMVKIKNQNLPPRKEEEIIARYLQGLKMRWAIEDQGTS